jgi:hypothetical protein
MRLLVTIHAQRRPGNHRYRLSQFGFSAEEVLNAFATYRQRFGLSDIDHEKRQLSPRDSSITQTQRRSGFVSLKKDGETDGSNTWTDALG